MPGMAATSLWLVLRGDGAQRVVSWMMLVGQGIELLLEEPWGLALHAPGELDVAGGARQRLDRRRAAHAVGAAP
jgi:hypothetical protein